MVLYKYADVLRLVLDYLENTQGSKVRSFHKIAAKSQVNFPKFVK